MLRFLLVILLALSNQQALATANAIFASKIIDIKSGEVISENNPSLPLNPASTLKTFTFYLALKKLGEDFKYKTEALRSGRNLYIRFSGDPTLTMQDLDTLIENVSKKGAAFDVVYLDGDIFGHELYAPGSSTDNLKFYYSSPISAFSIDKNYAQFVQSGDKGMSYRNTAEFNLLKLTNKAIPSKDLSLCPLELFNTGPNEYVLDGCYDTIPPKLSIAVTDPKKYARDAIMQLLKKYNIKANKVEFGKVSGKAVLVADHESKELRYLLKDMMYKSDNHISDSLVKLMTYKHFSRPASWFLVAKFLKSSAEQELDVDMSQLQILDGAGLSKKNYVNANFLISLLDHIYKDERARKLFFESVPHFGAEGSTLARRLSTLPGKIYAKTGSLENVSGLTGIMLGNNDKIYAFALLTSNFLDAGSSMKDMEDMLLTEMVGR